MAAERKWPFAAARRTGQIDPERDVRFERLDAVMNTGSSIVLTLCYRSSRNDLTTPLERAVRYVDLPCEHRVNNSHASNRAFG